MGFLENLGIISYNMPTAGIRKMYTSGWKVNQNKCWYAIGSPPISGLKKPEIPSLSVYNIISDAAKVGTATIIIRDVIRIDQDNRGIFIRGRSGCLHFNMVTTKLIAPRTEEIPSIFAPKIQRSAAGPGALIVE